ncbi:MAG: tetratricopeptide repeat protein [Bacteroidota bacterium]
MGKARIITYGAWLSAIAIVTLLIVQASCKQGGDANETNQSDSTTYASLDPHNGYVGMESCSSCHQSIYDSFIQTGMGKSFDLATKEKSSGRFGDHAPVYDPHLDFYYKPFWENDSLRILEFRLQGKDTVHKRIETVSYIVGSGQHTNSHIMNTFGYLNQMPLTFYTQKGKWDLPPGYEKGGNTRFNRLIGLECMSCHNSYPEFLPGSENRYDFVDNGIGCERCHGPGEKHVKEKQAGKIIDVVTGIDYSIVNPAKLPIDLQLDVCQRCHIQGNAVLKDGKSFFDFKPGMRLSEVMDVYMPVYDGPKNEHIMASHVERMKLSKCFTESIKRAPTNTKDLKPYKNALTCVTCHDPHVSVKSTGNAVFNNACNSCHTKAKDPLCSEKPQLLALKKYDCVSCHMPSSGATDIPHVSVHDHYIRIPDKAQEVDRIRKFLGIAALNNANPDSISKGRAFIAYHEKFGFDIDILDSAKKYVPYRKTSDLEKHYHEVIHILFLEKDYQGILDVVAKLGELNKKLQKKSFDNKDAWTAYRVGQAFAEKGNLGKSNIYYQVAYGLAPYVLDFVNKYAASLTAVGNNQEAKGILERLVYEYPKSAPALSNLGYLCLVLENDTVRARKLYDQAIGIDPDYEQAIVNKAGLWMVQGKKKEAAALLGNFIRRKPQSEQARQLLQRINAI